MKKFTLVILDDENELNLSRGWKRVFSLFLIPKHYVNDNSSIKLIDDSTLINDTYPFEVQFFRPDRYNYDIIYQKISEDKFQTNKDIYFIDMNWDNCFSINKTKVVEKNLEDISFSDISEGKIPSVLAGLNLLNILTKNDKPKIVFSGSDKTEIIRKLFKLLSNRVLADDILIGELKAAADNNYIDEVEQKVDSYLQSRQISIINLQNPAKIQELNCIVSAWNDCVCRADEPLIPDNVTDCSSENCWSLRTLFPKQVNKIEKQIEVAENKKIIYEVFNELNFRKIYKWLVGEHCGIDGKDINSLINDDIGKQLVLNRLNVFRNFEKDPYFNVSEKSKQYYKLCHEIIDLDNLDELVKKVDGHSTDIRDVIGTNFNDSGTSFSYNNSNNVLLVNFSDKELIKNLALNFGVYIGDIYFLYKCIKGNNKHNFSRDNIPCDYSPGLNIVVNCDNNSNTKNLVISVNVESDTEYFKGLNSRSNPLSEQKNRIDTKLKANPYYIELKEQAIVDYVSLFSKRYNAKIELQFGKTRLTVGSDRITNVEFLEKEIDKTEYVFTIESI